MEKNMGKTDRTIRAVLTVVFLYFGLTTKGLVMYLSLVLTIIMALTSAFGVCSLYGPLGINTLRSEEMRKQNKNKQKKPRK